MEAACCDLIVPGLIDSSLKLHVLLVFARHKQLCGGVSRLNHWLHRPPWDVEEALEELVGGGLLRRLTDESETSYCLDLPTHYAAQLTQLLLWYDDPFQREEIHKQVRIVHQELQLQRWQSNDYHLYSFSPYAFVTPH